MAQNTYSSEYFFFKSNTHYRGDGPGVEPMFRDIKKGQKEILLSKPWVDYIFSLNDWNEIAMARIIAKDYGPSKGYNGKGLLKYNSLVYPGRNIVKVERVLLDKNRKKWAVIHGIPMNGIPEPGLYNAFDSPHLVHKLYGVSRKGTFFEIKNPTFAPLLDLNWYFPFSKLVQIRLPKEVHVRVLTLAVRELPDAESEQTGSLFFGQGVFVTRLVTGCGGIWGEVPGGWITLRYRDANPTNWKI